VTTKNHKCIDQSGLLGKLDIEIVGMFDAACCGHFDRDGIISLLQIEKGPKDDYQQYNHAFHLAVPPVPAGGGCRLQHFLPAVYFNPLARLLFAIKPL
jgi:hypothetical protein